MATQLVDAKANLNAANSSGDTPLHDAAWYGCAGVADTLLAAKASLTAVNNDGRTPAQLAEYRGHGELAARLRKAGQASAPV